MHVLPELTSRCFDGLPLMESKQLTEYLSMAACLQISLYHSGGRGMVELTVVPSVLPSAAVMRTLEKGTLRVSPFGCHCQCGQMCHLTLAVSTACLRGVYAAVLKYAQWYSQVWREAAVVVNAAREFNFNTL